MAGLAVALLATWAWYVHNRLWQGSLLRDAADALGAAAGMGLQLQPLGYRARLVAIGQVSGSVVRVEWRGGPLGPRTVIYRGDTVKRMDLVVDEAGLAQATGATGRASPSA